MRQIMFPLNLINMCILNVPVFNYFKFLDSIDNVYVSLHTRTPGNAIRTLCQKCEGYVLNVQMHTAV